VVALFIWGGPVLHSFSFALVCGIIVGTYSSVFVASPIVLFWHNYADQRRPRTSATGTSAKSEAARKKPTKAVN
jgi:preprotein translocase subunit SecF